MARERFKQLELDGRKVSLDALHTQTQTARERVLEHGADFLLTVRDNPPPLRANLEKLVPAPPADFPRSASPTLAGQREFNQGQPASRVLRSLAATGANTRPKPSRGWLAFRLHPGTPRSGCHPSGPPGGIESGLHQRLDVSPLDDQGRVRKPKSMRVLRRFRRFSNRRFLHWPSRQYKPRPKATSDSFRAMYAELHRDALRCLHAPQPDFHAVS